ncbi:Adenylylsulfate kinase [Raoultella ornithinolytica]|nr:Adenylylsulfate kinase [Raoultella ornithinolytica]
MARHDENVVWHAHPVTREQREQHHGHRGCAVVYRASGSGKSTVAGALEEALHQLGVSTYLLDGITCGTACVAISVLAIAIVKKIFVVSGKWRS